jgi:hypothetical protein
LLSGELGLNINPTSGGVFFKNSVGDINKVGPVEVGTAAPNFTPAGSTGNSPGEMWLDTSLQQLNTYGYSWWNSVDANPPLPLDLLPSLTGVHIYSMKQQVTNSYTPILSQTTSGWTTPAWFQCRNVTDNASANNWTMANYAPLTGSTYVAMLRWHDQGSGLTVQATCDIIGATVPAPALRYCGQLMGPTAGTDQAIRKFTNVASQTGNPQTGTACWFILQFNAATSPANGRVYEFVSSNNFFNGKNLSFTRNGTTFYVDNGITRSFGEQTMNTTTLGKNTYLFIDRGPGQATRSSINGAATLTNGVVTTSTGYVNGSQAIGGPVPSTNAQNWASPIVTVAWWIGDPADLPPDQTLLNIANSLHASI